VQGGTSGVVSKVEAGSNGKMVEAAIRRVTTSRSRGEGGHCILCKTSGLASCLVVVVARAGSHRLPAERTADAVVQGRANTEAASGARMSAVDIRDRDSNCGVVVVALERVFGVVGGGSGSTEWR